MILIAQMPLPCYSFCLCKPTCLTFGFAFEPFWCVIRSTCGYAVPIIASKRNLSKANYCPEADLNCKTSVFLTRNSHRDVGVNLSFFVFAGVIEAEFEHTVVDLFGKSGNTWYIHLGYFITRSNSP